MILKYTATASGLTVYTVMRRELKVSAALVRRLKNSGGIFVDGVPVFTTHVLVPGQTLTLDISGAEPECDVVPEDGEVHIIYEDEGLIGVNKPCGMLSHPSRTRYMGTLANYVAGYLARTEGDPRCHAVGRLDRDTSGVVLFSKNSYYKALCAEALSSPVAKKWYLALVYGAMTPPSGIIDLPIRRAYEGDMLRIVASDGQRAVTHYETVFTEDFGFGSVSLLRLRLETGRTHQIRVHCLASGCPILGDVLYKTETSDAVSRAMSITAQALHAYTLSFVHPLTGKAVTISAPVLRQDMQKFVRLMDRTAQN